MKRCLPSQFKLAYVDQWSKALELVSKIPTVPLVVDLPQKGSETDELNALISHNDIRNAMVVSPRSNEENLDFLYLHPQVSSILSSQAKDFPLQLERAIKSRLQPEKAWGIEQYLSDPKDLVREQIFSYGGQSFLLTLGDYVSRLNCYSGFTDRVQTILTELLMNAVFDASPDEGLKRRRRELNLANQHVRLEKSESVIVSYAHDGDRFALSVSDNYGTLDRNRIVQSLLRCAMKQHDQVKLSEGRGAGIGLYTCYTSSDQLIFNVTPGQRTEAVCVLRLTKREKDALGKPKSVHFFVGRT